MAVKQNSRQTSVQHEVSIVAHESKRQMGLTVTEMISKSWQAMQLLHIMLLKNPTQPLLHLKVELRILLELPPAKNSREQPAHICSQRANTSGSRSSHLHCLTRDNLQRRRERRFYRNVSGPGNRIASKAPHSEEKQGKLHLWGFFSVPISIPTPCAFPCLHGCSCVTSFPSWAASLGPQTSATF